MTAASSKFLARVLLALFILSLATTARADDTDDPINPFLPGSLASNVQNTITSMAAGAREKAKFTTQIAQARQRFFAAFPNGPDRKAAWADFQDLLRQKDLYYLWLSQYPSAPLFDTSDQAAAKAQEVDSVLTLGSAPVDGGIAVPAQGQFNKWVAQVRSAGGSAAPATANDLARQVTVSAAAVEAQYFRYCLVRNSLEFANAGRQMTNDPKTYATLLLYMREPWRNDDTPASPTFRTDAADYYRTLSNFFGEPAILNAAKQVMAARQTALGELNPPLRVNGRDYPVPFDAWNALLSDGDPHKYLDTVIATYPRHADLAAADSLYARFTTAFGDARAARAAAQIMAAPKDQNGNLAPPLQVAGVDWSDPYEAWRAMLGTDDPHKYIVSLINLTFAADDLDRAQTFYDRFVAAYGQKTILAVADQIRLAPKEIFYDPEQVDVILNNAQAFGLKGQPSYSASRASELLYSLFQDMLAAQDPAGAARATLTFHDKLNTVSAVDADYAKLTGQYGADKVADAEKAIQVFWATPDDVLPTDARYLTPYSPIPNPTGVTDTGSHLPRVDRATLRQGLELDDYKLLTQVLSGARTLPTVSAADLIDNPNYVCWSKYPLGTIVTHASRTWREIDGRINNDPNNGAIRFTTSKLLYVSPDQVVVQSVSRTYLPAGSVDADGQLLRRATLSPLAEPAEVTYPVKLRKDSPKNDPGDVVALRQEAAHRTRPPTSSPSENDQTASQTLAVLGKQLSCQVQIRAFKSGSYIVWTSDQIPGGIVQKMTARPTATRYVNVGNTNDVAASIVVTPIKDLGLPMALPPVTFPTYADSPASPAPSLLAQTPSSPPPTNDVIISKKLAAAAPAPPSTEPSGPPTIPARSVLELRLLDPITLDTVDADHHFHAQLIRGLHSTQGKIVVPPLTDVYVTAAQQPVPNRPKLVEITISAAYLMLDGKQIDLTTQAARPIFAQLARPDVAQAGRVLNLRLVDSATIPPANSPTTSPTTESAMPATSP